MASAKLRNLQHRRDIRLSIKCRVYPTTIRPELICTSEKWPFSGGDKRKRSRLNIVAFVVSVEYGGRIW